MEERGTTMEVSWSSTGNNEPRSIFNRAAPGIITAKSEELIAMARKSSRITI